MTRIVKDLDQRSPLLQPVKKLPGPTAYRVIPARAQPPRFEAARDMVAMRRPTLLIGRWQPVRVPHQGFGATPAMVYSGEAQRERLQAQREHRHEQAADLRASLPFIVGLGAMAGGIPAACAAVNAAMLTIATAGSALLFGTLASAVLGGMLAHAWILERQARRLDVELQTAVRLRQSMVTGESPAPTPQPAEEGLRV